MKGGEKQWHVDVLAEQMQVWLICKPTALQEVANLALRSIPKYCMQTRNNFADKAMVRQQSRFAQSEQAAAINLIFAKEGDMNSPSFCLGGIGMWVNMLICDKIDVRDNQFILGQIVNKLTVPTYPFVIQFSCLIKLTGLPELDTVQTELKVVNSNAGIMGNTLLQVHRNYRENYMVPGVDQYFDFKVLVEQNENIYIECFVDGELKSRYPININLVEMAG